MKVQSSQVVMGFQPLKSDSNMTKRLMMELPSQHIEVCFPMVPTLIKSFTSAGKSSMSPKLRSPCEGDESVLSEIIELEAVVSFNTGRKL